MLSFSRDYRDEVSKITPHTNTGVLQLTTKIYTDGDINLETLPNTTQSIHQETKLIFNHSFKDADATSLTLNDSHLIGTHL